MLIVTEKYRTAAIIAKSLGFRHFEFDHFSNDHGDKVCFAAGHLFDVDHKDPETYSWKTPDNFNTLPKTLHSVPRQFTPFVRGNNIPSTELLATITNEMRQHDMIVNACDFDREGERIFYDIFNAAQTSANVYRMDLSKGLSRRLVCEAFANLLDGAVTKSRYYASSARNCADFAYALLTQVSTFYARQGNLHPSLSGFKEAKSSTLSIGRVQVPLVLLIAIQCRTVEQYSNRTVTLPLLTAKISRYKCEFYYDTERSNTDPNLLERGRLAKRYIQVRDSMSRQVKVVAIDINEFESLPPAPHNTPSVQAAMSNLTPKETMDAMQQLYMKGLISYPRSDSEELNSGHYSNGRLASLLESLAVNDGFTKKADDEESLNALAHSLEFANAPSCVQDQSVAAHSAIVPTDVSQVPQDLSENEQAVYNEICGRFVESVSGSKMCQTITVSVQFTDEVLGVLGESASIFTCEKTLSAGSNKLASLKVGDVFDIDTLSVSPYQRDVPKYYSISELPMVMFKAGLGTAATRDNAVATIIKRGYVEAFMEGGIKTAVVTAKGLGLLEILPAEFKDPKLTARWESALTTIEHTVDNEKAIELRNQFVTGVFHNVQYLCRLFNTGQINIREATAPATKEMQEQVTDRAKALNVDIDISLFTTKRACYDFLLANPLSLHQRQKNELARSGLEINSDILRDSRRVSLRHKQTGKDNPPSPSQRTTALNLAALVHIKVPPQALKSAAKCHEFIELCASKRKPSVGQIKALKKIAQELNYPLEQSVLLSRNKTKALMKELLKRKKRKQA